MPEPTTGSFVTESQRPPCSLCVVAAPEYAAGMCDQFDHVGDRIVLALALADAVNPSEEPKDRAWRALSFLDDDVLGIMDDLGPQTEWNVQASDMFEGATINGVAFVLVPDEANGRLHPKFPDGLACPHCRTPLKQLGGATWMNEDYAAGTVEIECQECYEVVTAPVWWLRAPTAKGRLRDDTGTASIITFGAACIAGALLWLAVLAGGQQVMCAAHDDALRYCPGYTAEVQR
jgi:hypothetical protein